jgi:drug/metabolite transporter (DMT)-like permease
MVPALSRPALIEAFFMPRRLSGLLWCATFVVLDATQAVVLGNTLQRLDSFLVGLLVFGVPSIACLAAAPWYAPGQIAIALKDVRSLAALNVCTGVGWAVYLCAVQLIEPAVVVTIFSGTIPIALITAAAAGVREAEPLANRIELAGIWIIALAIAALSAITLTGLSGFMRGDALAGLAGLVLTVVSGFMMAGMLLASYRLSRQGVGPAAMFGLRFPLYLALTGAGFLLGLDVKDGASMSELLLVVAVGLVVIAFPIYAVQKAVTLASALTVGAATALIPVVVFVLQMIEGRVAYSNATLAGLAIYIAGAVVSVAGRLLALGAERDPAASSVS